MSNIIDLDLLSDQTITFKIGDKVIEIPESPKTSLVIKMMSLEEKMGNSSSPEEQFASFIEMVSLILSQGDEKVTKKFVEDNFSMTQMKQVVKVYGDVMKKIEKDPN